MKLNLQFLLIAFFLSCSANQAPIGDTSSASTPSSASSAAEQKESLWTCTAEDSTYERSAADTVLKSLQISILGTLTPNPVQFQTFMRFTRYGRTYKICPQSQNGNVMRVVRGDSLLQAGVRKTSTSGELMLLVKVDTTTVFESDFSESLQPILYP